MQHKPILLALTGIGAAGLAFFLIGPGETVTVPTKKPAARHADVHAERQGPALELSNGGPGRRKPPGDTGGPGGPNGPRGKGGKASGRFGPPGGDRDEEEGSTMVMAGGPGDREGGMAIQHQPTMTADEAEQQHQQVMRGMQQNLSTVATKHNLSSKTTDELSSALEDYLNNQKSLWDSVANGEMSSEDAMSAAEEARSAVEGKITDAAGQGVADEMGSMLGGGAPGDATGGPGGPSMGGGQQPPPGGEQPPGGMQGGPPPGGGMGPGGGGGMGPPGGGGMPPPGGGGMGPPKGGP